MSLIDEVITLGHLYGNVISAADDAAPRAGGAAPRSSKTQYRLIGMICYYGLHYVGTADRSSSSAVLLPLTDTSACTRTRRSALAAFRYSTSRRMWSMFDDTIVKPVRGRRPRGGRRCPSSANSMQPKTPLYLAH